MYVKQKDRGLNSSTDPEAWKWGFPYKIISQNEILSISSIAIKSHRKKGPAYEGKEGIYFYINGFIHRDNDLPAAIYNKRKDWFQYGIRDEFPAIEYANGDKEYWILGKRHRENGPAVIYGKKQYWYTHGEFIKCIV